MSSSAMLPRLQRWDAAMHWDELQEGSDLTGAQDLIREAIRAGAIRVVPGEEGRVRIIPGPAQARSLDGAGPRRHAPAPPTPGARPMAPPWQGRPRRRAQ